MTRVQKICGRAKMKNVIQIIEIEGYLTQTTLKKSIYMSIGNRKI